MFSATDFLPRVITTFMNLASSTFPNFGSGRISRFGTSRRRGMAIVPCFSDSGHCAAGDARAANGLTAVRWLLGPACGTSSCLRLLRAVLRARLLAVLDTRGVERAAHHVVAHAGKVLHSAAWYDDH